MKKLGLLSVVLCALLVTGCAGMSQREQRVVSGTAIGAAAGAGAGALIPGMGIATGTAIGAAGGAVTGLIVHEASD